MPFAKAPSVRLRRIGSALRKAREENGMTVDTASRRYGTFVESEADVATFERIFAHFRRSALDERPVWRRRCRRSR